MAQLVDLLNVDLVPVVELEPWTFARQQHPRPGESRRDTPAEWDHYWRACLADVGIVGVDPLQCGSWHASTEQFVRRPADLAKLVAFFVDEWGGAPTFEDPDRNPVLGGGLAFCTGSEVLAEPQCCVDLTNLADWQRAVHCRDEGWSMLWIGHPWLSVRYEAPHLVLSDRHESNEPIAQWLIAPKLLRRAVVRAAKALEQFAVSLRTPLEALGVTDSIANARRLAGLPPRRAYVQPSWRTPTVLSLAQVIDGESAFASLPILADALEDAGCTERDILDHCRQPGEHVRGCWVVDLLLGK